MAGVSMLWDSLSIIEPLLHNGVTTCSGVNREKRRCGIRIAKATYMGTIGQIRNLGTMDPQSNDATHLLYAIVCNTLCGYHGSQRERVYGKCLRVMSNIDIEPEPDVDAFLDDSTVDDVDSTATTVVEEDEEEVDEEEPVHLIATAVEHPCALRRSTPYPSPPPTPINTRTSPVISRTDVQDYTAPEAIPTSPFTENSGTRVTGDQREQSTSPSTSDIHSRLTSLEQHFLDTSAQLDQLMLAVSELSSNLSRANADNSLVRRSSSNRHSALVHSSGLEAASLSLGASAEQGTAIVRYDPSFLAEYETCEPTPVIPSCNTELVRFENTTKNVGADGISTLTKVLGLCTKGFKRDFDHWSALLLMYAYAFATIALVGLMKVLNTTHTTTIT